MPGRKGHGFALMMANPDATLGEEGLPVPEDRVRIGHTRSKSLSRETGTEDAGSDETAPFAAPVPGERTRSVEGAGVAVYDDAGQAMAEYWEKYSTLEEMPFVLWVPVEKTPQGDWQASGGPTKGARAVITQWEESAGGRNSMTEFNFGADFHGELVRVPPLERPATPSQSTTGG